MPGFEISNEGVERRGGSQDPLRLTYDLRRSPRREEHNGLTDKEWRVLCKKALKTVKRRRA